MKKAWRVVILVLVACLAFGSICALVGALTGADTARIGAVIEQRVEQRYNVDLDATLHEWLPEVQKILTEEVSAGSAETEANHA